MKKKNGLKRKIVFTTVVLAIAVVLNSAISIFKASVQARLAVSQVDDSIVEYSLINLVVTRDIVPYTFSAIAIALFVYVWRNELKEGILYCISLIKN